MVFLFAPERWCFWSASPPRRGYLAFFQDLPDYRQLQDSIAGDGRAFMPPMALARRIFQGTPLVSAVQAVPKMVITPSWLPRQEISTSPRHRFSGMARAAVLYARIPAPTSGRRAASTINPQVAKNFPSSFDQRVSFTRDQGSAAGNADAAHLPKDKILELYLNEIISSLAPTAAPRIAGFIRQIGQRANHRGKRLIWRPLPKAPAALHPVKTATARSSVALTWSTVCLENGWIRVRTPTRPARIH